MLTRSWPSAEIVGALVLTSTGFIAMELRHLRYFIAVAEELSFTRAAERLGIKQPPLSLQIRQLEEELGTVLLRRLTRGVELTDAGKLFLEQVRDILAEVDQAKIDVKRRSRGETGRIYVGASGACYFHPLVILIVSHFLKSYPDVVLSAEESNSAMLIAEVHAGKIDAAFVRSPTVEYNDLALEPIVEEDTLVAMSEETAMRYPPTVSLAALAKEKFIIFPRRYNVGLYDSIIESCQRAGFQPILGQEAPGIVAVIPMVASGCGISIVTQSLSRLGLKGVTYLPIRGQRPAAPIKLTYRPDDRSPLVKNLVSLVRRSIRPVAERKTSGATCRAANS